MNNLNTRYILEIFRKNYILLVLVFSVVAAASYFASFLLREKYKSKSIVFPVNIIQNSKESATEQLMQYLLSNEVKNKILNDFKLFEYYGIDSTKKGGKALFDYVYSENFKISPTLYESVEISVEDEHPDMAQKLNWAVVNYTNLFIRESKTKIVKQFFLNSQSVLAFENRELDSLNNLIKKYKLEHNSSDDSENNISFKKEKNAEIKMLNGKIKAILKAYEKIKVINDTYLIDANAVNDFVTIVSKPNLPDKRSFPIRWVITLTSGLSSLFLVFIFLLIKNRNYTTV